MWIVTGFLLCIKVSDKASQFERNKKNKLNREKEYD